jgi:hypothetical protein
MTFEEFQYHINSIKNFMSELDAFDNLLRVISPSGTCVCEIGSTLIDDYIKLVEKLLNDDDECVSWFVFENKFGESKLAFRIDGIEYIIANEKDFYDVIQKISEKN